MPRYLMEEQRTIVILEAMLRYVNAGLSIPVEWTDELNDLASEKRWRSEYLVPEAPEAPAAATNNLIKKIKEIRNAQGAVAAYIKSQDELLAIVTELEALK
jgi:hypothetical protein